MLGVISGVRVDAVDNGGGSVVRQVVGDSDERTRLQLHAGFDLLRVHFAAPHGEAGVTTAGVAVDLNDYSYRVV